MVAGEAPNALENVMSGGLANAVEKREEQKARARLCCALVLWALCLALVTLQPSCSQKRIEETVTVDAGRSSTSTVNAQPVAIAPQLPARDADLEQAGDRIAEAVMHLKKRQAAAALTALGQSRAALNRALRGDGRDEDGREALRLTLRGIEAAEHTIQRGALTDAAAQLVALNRKVDSIGIRQK
jgi:hypothetical protein